MAKKQAKAAAPKGPPAKAKGRKGGKGKKGAADAEAATPAVTRGPRAGIVDRLAVLLTAAFFLTLAAQHVVI